MTDHARKDEFMADLAAQGKLHLQLGLAVEIVDGSIRVGEPLTLESMQGLAVSVSGVPVSSLVAQAWTAEGTFVDSKRIRLQSVDRVPARPDRLRIARTSRRIERPPCRAFIRMNEAESAAEAECLDLSAGGIGLQLNEKVAFAVGDPVIVDLQWRDTRQTLEGLVAHAEGGRRSTRLGVQFTPMDHDLASAFYSRLNECAGETLVDARPVLEAVPLFKDALLHGSMTLTREFVVQVDGDDIVVCDTLPSSWLKGPARLHARNPHGSWTAIVLGDGSGLFTLTQIGHTEDARPDVRASGYRVSTPRGTEVQLRASEAAAPIEAIPVDLSRGGIGVDVPGDTDISAAQVYDIDLIVPSTNFRHQLQGRVAFARRGAESEPMRVGIRFLELSDEARQDLETTLSRLEDRLVFRQFVVFGTGVLLFLLALLVFGTLVTPKRDPATPPADSTMALPAQDAAKR